MPELVISTAARLRALVPLSVAFALLSVVFGIVWAMRPTDLLTTTQDLQRRSDLQNLVIAMHSYAMEHGDFLPDVPATGTGREVCRNSQTPKPCIELTPLLGSILNSVPYDPVAPDQHTYYFLHRTPQGRLMGNTLGTPPIPLLSVVK